MKRDHSFSKAPLNNILKWLISFLISVVVLVVLMLILTLVQKRFRLDEHILRIILIIFLTVSAGLCTFIYRRLSNIKGYVCGLITAGIYSFIKLIMSLTSSGVGKDNFLIYACIISAALIGGILSANKKKKTKW